MSSVGAPIGVIAGEGALPLALIGAARRSGRRVVCVGVFEADPRLCGLADAYHAVPLGDVSGIVDVLREHGVREVVLAGKIDKMRVWREARLGVADGAAAAAALPDHRDTTVLNAFLGMLHRAGLRIADQSAYLRDLLPAAGALAARQPTPEEAADIGVGLRLASAVAALDIGQAVAVRRGVAVAIEAAEGTDAMIRRAGALAAGTVIVKVSRPEQDPRYDLPAVGRETVEAMIEARATALAVEAGRTLVLDRDALIQAADASGIAVVAAAVPLPAAG